MSKETQNFLESLGRSSQHFFTSIWEGWLLFIETLKALPTIWFYRKQLSEQIYSFLVKTLPIATVIAVFVGLGAMIQGTYQSSALVPRTYVINVIFKSTILELCPIILSLVLAGRLGASLAAELGSMKISEQVEALETMSLDPIGFLVMPRVIAGMTMLPVMAIFANFLAMFSVFFIATVATDWISAKEFVMGMQMNFRAFELYFGNLIKPAINGFFIALIGSYFGLKTHGGALGVGRSSTNAVVVSAVLIVFFDYYLARLLL
ncbi:MAG: ABC transporter permease [Candidatus Aminicenantes bacterium]|nr:ABC transporter permease [Candidatus Aminicenantes bacterium]